MNDVAISAFFDELEKIGFAKEAGVVGKLISKLSPASSQMSKAVTKSQGKKTLLQRMKGAVTTDASRMQKAVSKSKGAPITPKATAGAQKSAPRVAPPAPAPVQNVPVRNAPAPNVAPASGRSYLLPGLAAAGGVALGAGGMAMAQGGSPSAARY